MSTRVHVVDHPLVQHKLGLMRMKSTSTSAYRNLLAEISQLLAYEVTRDMPTHQVNVETPLARTSVPMLDGKKIVLISILRAGTGILDGILKLIPSARVGHVGLYRDPKTLTAVEYYFKVPREMGDRDALRPHHLAEIRAAQPHPGQRLGVEGAPEQIAGELRKVSRQIVPPAT